MANVLKYSLFALSCATLLSACTGESQSKQNTVTNPQNGKVYRVVTEQIKPPLVVYVDGKPTGFEYDVLQAIAAKQGLTFEYQVVDKRADLLNSIVDGKADIAAGAITINDVRKAKVDFSEPVVDYTATVLVDKSLANAKSLADLKGKKVASRHDTVYEKMTLDNLAENNGQNIQYYDTVWGEIRSILNQENEVMLGDSLILNYYLQQSGSRDTTFAQGITFPKESYGFAVAKGNTELQKQLNEGLAAIRADGTYGKIYQTYWQTQK